LSDTTHTIKVAVKSGRIFNDGFQYIIK